MITVLLITCFSLIFSISTPSLRIIRLVLRVLDSLMISVLMLDLKLSISSALARRRGPSSSCRSMSRRGSRKTLLEVPAIT